jgi:hypothetical protein
MKMQMRGVSGWGNHWVVMVFVTLSARSNSEVAAALGHLRDVADGSWGGEDV